MTFLEAAIEILKREGKPLHFKDLTRLAIKHNLLTVVGRDPEGTMEAQLTAALKRESEGLVQTKAGLFGLRAFPPRSKTQRNQMSAREAQEEPENLSRPRARGRRRPEGGGEASHVAAAANTEGEAMNNHAAAEAADETPEHSEDTTPQRRRRGGRAHPAVRAEEAGEARPAEAPAPAPAAIKEEAAPAASAPVASAPAASSATPAQPAEAQDEGGGPRGNPPAAPPEGKPGEPPPRTMAFADAVLDVLRGSSDGRPMHFRQITDIALKRRLVRGEAADLWRTLRAAVVRDQRQRDADGLRHRVRNLGQGQYLLLDRKLEPELLTAEKELLDRLNRTREATRVALRRRLRAMPASAFELMMRLLLERLGMVAADLIKRGEGVAYYAGSLTRGTRTLKVLAGLRSGEAEVSREAVGELRAGVHLRGFDEGLLLCAGRANPAAVAEVNAAPGIDLYDQDPLTDLLIRHQIGVRRASLPIEYIDVELFSELLEPV